MNNVINAMLVHLQITFTGVLLACAAGLPLAAVLVKRPRLCKFVFAIVDGLQTIPTLAMFTFVMLIFGLNDRAVIAAIFLYSLFPVVRNTYVGLCSVDKGIIRAGKGIGMTKLQVFTKIRYPLALPAILTGIRLAVVSALGIATTGVFIGSGGLGMLVWRGIQTRNMNMMLSGAIPVCVLALIFEYVLGLAEKKMTKRTSRK